MDQPVVRLASSVVDPLISPLLVPGSVAAAAEASPSGRLMADLVAYRGEEPTLGWAELSEVAAELVRLGLQATGQELPADEETGVAALLAGSLWAAGDLDTTDADAVRLGPHAYARRLHSAVRQHGSELSDEAAWFFEDLLAAVCLHLLHHIVERSPSLGTSLPDQCDHVRELVEREDREALAVQAARPAAEDAEFEERYLRHIAEQYNRVTIYGIDLPNPDAPDHWSLDATYLNLSAEFGSEDDTDEATGDGEDPSPRSARPDDDEDDATGPGAAGGGAAPVMTADRALARHKRVLLRGVAGSGKTTLIQWLAVSTARAALPEELQTLHGRIPFVLPVRRFADEGFPAPAQFLSSVRHPLAAKAPEGWVERVLAAERGLLLVDGIDEAPEPQREAVRAQLRPLLQRYSGNLCLVTSRPPAVDADWPAEDGFTEITLAPMNRDQVAAFVTAWHTAAGRDEGRDHARLNDYKDMLLRSIPLFRELRVLATNPLMCGLICALNRDRSGSLPKGRRELYDAAMKMLLERRDPERRVKADTVDLPRAPREALLRKLAFRMLTGKRTVLDHADALQEIALHLPAMPKVAGEGSPEEIFDHLLERTGLLREQADRSVEFVHRTVQDHLAAKEAVEQGKLDLLLEHAHEPEWEEVFRMAVAHARPGECATLLQGLLAPGALGMKRKRRRLMAAACLEYVTELDPETHARVRRETQNMVSPADDRAARGLGWVGPIVLEMIPDPAQVTDERAYRLALTVTRIEDDAAVDYLARMRDRKSLKVRTELARGWRNFETERYAAEVIRHLDPEGLFFPVADRAELRELRNLGGRERVKIVGRFSPGELLDGLVADRLTHLWIAYDLGAGMKTEWLSSFPSLTTLRVDPRLPPVTGVPEGIRVIEHPA
ncbi:NACHT domain-containing NTPase [Streptomyces sp. WMMB 322]|uniref:NACHT domain-containing protein n=1 Tax=Streptomyces sp. WMMB 322 TaxID=1286821 RepID=UPI0006E3C73F|nr:NACHT domain-containing protein [Streptomyces sp. WMMB 322]SCK58304.1 Predicted NTPase, NACHT family domain [Streptomyces sp. WMMB 322]